MIVVEIAVFVLGTFVIGATVLSAIRTVVLPHGRASNLTRMLFVAMGRAFDLRRRLPLRARRRYEVGALHAPVTLVLLPIVWLTGALVGFTAMYWALDVRPLREAVQMAGSTMLTLDSSGLSDVPRMVLSFVAAGLTISLFALLLVTYLPSMYQAYSAREQQLIGLETVGGAPPRPVDLLVRLHRIGGIEQLDELFVSWKHWFFEARETHTAFPAVVLFRSASRERRWVPAVAALLDTAALWNSIRSGEEDPAASLCIRAGSITLNDIAELFRFDVDRDPSPDDPISIDRTEFDEMLRSLEEEGIEIERSDDDAWTAWAGWRVNYDAAVVQLASLTGAEPD